MNLCWESIVKFDVISAIWVSSGVRFTVSTNTDLSDKNFYEKDLAFSVLAWKMGVLVCSLTASQSVTQSVSLLVVIIKSAGFYLLQPRLFIWVRLQVIFVVMLSHFSWLLVRWNLKDYNPLFICWQSGAQKFISTLDRFCYQNQSFLTSGAVTNRALPIRALCPSWLWFLCCPHCFPQYLWFGWLLCTTLSIAPFHRTISCTVNFLIDFNALTKQSSKAVSWRCPVALLSLRKPSSSSH